MRESPLLVAILGALGGCTQTFEDKGCMDVAPTVTSCPARGHVNPAQLYLPDKCGDDLEITEVLSEGKVESVALQTGEQLACCYRVEVVDHDTNMDCAVGRPYYEAGAALLAPLRGTTALDSASARGVAWAHAGAGEHASVAAFSRLALQLMAHGAPSELLRGVHQAALDEVNHAEQCWALARRFGVSVSAAGAFPFSEAVDVGVTLAELASAAALEGCLAETLGAQVLSVAAELAPDPAIASALHAIAEDETAHAVLSYRIVAWALSTGGAAVRAAVVAAFASPAPTLDTTELAVRAGVDERLLRRAAADAVTNVLAPAIERLLATAPAAIAQA